MKMGIGAWKFKLFQQSNHIRKKKEADSLKNLENQKHRRLNYLLKCELISTLPRKNRQQTKKDCKSLREEQMNSNIETIKVNTATCFCQVFFLFFSYTHFAAFVFVDTSLKSGNKQITGSTELFVWFQIWFRKNICLQKNKNIFSVFLDWFHFEFGIKFWKSCSNQCEISIFFFWIPSDEIF